MKHISILVLEGATLTSLDGTHQLFTRINDFLKYNGQKEFYSIDLVATKEQTTLNNGLYKIRATKTIDEKFKTDLIIIPIICGDFSKMNKANEVFTDWVKEQYRKGSEIASLCVGSFFLASTGIYRVATWFVGLLCRKFNLLELVRVSYKFFYCTNP